MKKIRVVLTVLIVILIALAWLSQITTIMKNEKEYALLLDNADHLYEEKLYEQAIQVYEEAIKIEDDSNAREKWISAFELGYMDGVITKKEYSNALIEMCSKQPKNAVYWEKLITLCVENGEYTSANDYLQKANRSGVKSEALNILSESIRYSYTTKSKTYVAFYRSPDGYYSLFDDRNWGIIDPSGEWLFERIYVYASPVGSDHSAVLTSTRDSRVIAETGIVEAILRENILEARAIGNMILPLNTDNGWRYFDITQKQFIGETYDNASSFSGGTAAVHKNGQWILINASGEQVSSQRFDDIKMFGNGDYSYKGIMVASEGGTYRLYDQTGALKNDFKCSDADLYLGEPIAYKDATGKWGFVNIDGDIVITPQFDEAKSFSNGLAAVAIDGQWGFIDEQGKTVIDAQFEFADYFTSKGLCVVSDFEGNFYFIKLRFLG